MASQIMFYKCDTCQTTYKNKRDAEICEKTHTTFDKIDELIYNSNLNFYPSFLVAKFSNGFNQLYKLVPDAEDL